MCCSTVPLGRGCGGGLGSALFYLRPAGGKVVALIQCSMCSGTFDDSRQLCPGCGFRVPIQVTVDSAQEKRPDAELLANAGYRLGPPSNELDGYTICFYALVSPFFLFATYLIISLASPSADGPAEQQYNARHSAQMDRYMLRGMTPQEANQAIRRNEEILRYWENR
jgi:hypothetical protein